jgi:hypothetical protein
MTAINDLSAPLAFSAVLARLNHFASPDRGRPLEYFGARPVGIGETPVDNLTALQAALDWSSSTGGALFAGSGLYGFDGTLTLDNDVTLIGTGIHSTHFQQMSWGVDCMTYASNAGVGAGGQTLMGFTLDGGWDRKGAEGVGANWDFDPATMDQVGLELFQTISAVNEGGLENRVDPYSRLMNLRVRNVGGVGIKTGGRGEIFVDGLDVDGCATAGLEWGAFDCWLTNMSIHVTGECGLKLTTGNMRIATTKLWFTGMCKQARAAETYGFMMTEPAMTAIDASISLQDTWSGGALIQGHGNKISRQADSIGALPWTGGGSALNTGFGADATGRGDYHVVEFGNAQDCLIDIAVSGRGTDVPQYAADLPGLVNFDSSGADGNVIRAVSSHYSDDDRLDPTKIVSQSFANRNAKKANIVEYHGARQIVCGDFAGPTTALLSDATDGLNLKPFKRLGQQVLNATTNQQLWASGDGATDPWVDTDGATVITPA